MRKLLGIMLVLAMAAGASIPAAAEENAKSDDIVILYTNDIHTYIDKELSYDVLASIKQELEAEYEHVLLVDAGDHIQGTAYGSMDKGQNIVELMNAVGYDAAAIGNHEFDYGMDGFMNVVDLADYSYVSCNFYHMNDGVPGDTVVDSYRMFDCGGYQVAVVGITTPESFSTNAYFQDEDGNYIYWIDRGTDGTSLYADVQKAIDAAEAEGADTIIALGHLGLEEVAHPWCSTDVIANTCGLDAFIDGHSHSVVEGELIADEDGHSVILTQTGEYFSRIGMMIIDAETGAITTDFIELDTSDEENPVLSSELYAGTILSRDSTIGAIKEAWLTEIDDKLGNTIGSFSENVALKAYGLYPGAESLGIVRIIRGQETNAGDFAADALYYLFDNLDMDVDVAIMNGGGILGKYQDPVTGEISYMTCKQIHPYGNVACLQTVTGQQILDALEWGSRLVGQELKGSFLQVAGLKYKLNPEIEHTIQVDANGLWIGSPAGEYRVYDVEVYSKENDTYEPLDLTAEYNIAGYNYILRDLGDGFAMFEDCVNVLDYVMEDYQVLANYIQAFENGCVDAYNSPLLEKYPGMLMDYSNPNGSGRICIDLDIDHYCDLCGLLIGECVDETPHDHWCDICGDLTYRTSPADDGFYICASEGCTARETQITADYIELTYRQDENGEIVADGKVEVTGKIVNSAKWYDGLPFDPASGTVTLTWTESKTEYDEETDAFIDITKVYTPVNAELVLDETGKAVAEFCGLPADALHFGDLLLIPADTANNLPAANGLVLEYQENVFPVNVYSSTEVRINGLETDMLYLFAGDEVTVEFVSENEGDYTISFGEENENPEYSRNGMTIFFPVPEQEVEITAEWICAECADNDGDDLCDVCWNEIAAAGDESAHERFRRFGFIHYLLHH